MPAVVDSPENEQGLAPWFLDTVVVERRRAPEMATVVLETASPVGLTHPVHENVRPKHRSRRLECRWVPDPRGEQSCICIWVPQTGPEASAPRRES